MFILELDGAEIDSFKSRPSLRQIVNSFNKAVSNLYGPIDFDELTTVQYKLEGSVKDYFEGAFQNTFDMLFSGQCIELFIDASEYYLQLKENIPT